MSIEQNKQHAKGLLSVSNHTSAKRHCLKQFASVKVNAHRSGLLRDHWRFGLLTALRSIAAKAVVPALNLPCRFVQRSMFCQAPQTQLHVGKSQI